MSDRVADKVAHDGAAPDLVSAPGYSIDIDTILSTPAEDLETPYIVAPWIPVGITTIAGRFGISKSKVIADLAVARATGQQWLGLDVEPGPVLIWSAEQGAREDGRSVQSLCRGRGLRTEDFVHPFELITEPRARFTAFLEYTLGRVIECPNLLVILDSLRRAFAGDENDSASADEFFRSVLTRLRAAGASVVTLAHPPKLSGQVKRIDDESMVRGSGDFVNMLDSFIVLRPVNRERVDPETEHIVIRMTHVKGRSGRMAEPLLVTMEVTNDDTPEVAFRFSARPATADDGAAEIAGAVADGASLFEERKRLGRRDFLGAMVKGDRGRPACEKALKKLVDLGIVRGPLPPEERRRGERGHVFVFVRSAPASSVQDAWEFGPEDDDA